jgi:hypothetical protein
MMPEFAPGEIIAHNTELSLGMPIEEKQKGE